MNDLTIVGMGQGVRDLNSIARHGLRREPRAARHFVQVLSFNQLHDKIEAAIDAADLVDRADIGVIECRGGLRLFQEVVLAEMVQHARGQDLNRHVAIQFCVPGAVDNTHPSLADLGGQVIMV